MLGRINLGAPNFKESILRMQGDVLERGAM